MFLFKIISTQEIILHCGDFRACPAMEEYPSLWNNRVDKVFLDTTYCRPEYDFPSQGDAVSTSIELIHNHLQIHPNTLVVCGTYTVGKNPYVSAKTFRAHSKNLLIKLIFYSTTKITWLISIQ